MDNIVDIEEYNQDGHLSSSKQRQSELDEEMSNLHIENGSNTKIKQKVEYLLKSQSHNGSMSEASRDIDDERQERHQMMSSGVHKEEDDNDDDDEEDSPDEDCVITQK